VDVEVERAAEPLDDGDAARLTITNPAPARAPALEGEQGARIHSEDGAAQVVVPSQ